MSSQKKTSKQASTGLDTRKGLYGYADGAKGYGMRKVWISPLRNVWIQKKYNTPLVIARRYHRLPFAQFRVLITPPGT